MKKPKRALPVPESIDGESWSIKDSQGMDAPQVSLQDRIMWVPLDSENRSLGIKAHEQAHAAACSPAHAPGVPHLLWNAVEDARVNQWLLDHGVTSLKEYGSIDEDVARVAIARIADWKTLIMFGVASNGDGCQRVVREATHNNTIVDPRKKQRAMELIDQTITKIRVAANGEDAIKVAQWLVEQINEEEERDELDEQEQKTLAPLDRFEQSYDNIAEIDEARERERAEREAKQHGTTVTEALQAKPYKPRLDHVGSEWGRMEIETPPLTRKVKRDTVLHRGKWRATDQGTRIRKLHRICTDRRIFATKKRTPGGTVLFDVSGSMCLRSEDIATLIKTAPACKVAMYCGSQDMGVLTVLADFERMASEDAVTKRIGNQNIIDGPAVEWLANQPEPRIWVSDGYVTSKNEGLPKPSLMKKLKRTLIRNRIVRVDRTLEATEILEQFHQRRHRKVTVGYDELVRDLCGDLYGLP